MDGSIRAMEEHGHRCHSRKSQDRYLQVKASTQGPENFSWDRTTQREMDNLALKLRGVMLRSNDDIAFSQGSSRVSTLSQRSQRPEKSKLVLKIFSRPGVLQHSEYCSAVEILRAVNKCLQVKGLRPFGDKSGQSEVDEDEGVKALACFIVEKHQEGSLAHGVASRRRAVGGRRQREWDVSLPLVQSYASQAELDPK